MSSRRNDAIKLLLGITCVAGFITAIFKISERHFSRVEIVSHDGQPPMASSDVAALRGYLDPQIDDPSLSILKTSGRLFELQPGTKARALTRDTLCHGGANSYLQIKVLDGPRAGQAVWIGSMNLQCQWPISP
jgi:hypothetical protein